MPAVEHDLHGTVPRPFVLLLILPLLLIGTVRAGEESPPAAEARAELLRFAAETADGDAAWEARLRAARLAPEGEVFRAELEALLAEREDPRARMDLAAYRYALGAYEGAAEDYGRAADRLEGEERDEALGWRGAALAASGRRGQGLDLLLRVARGEGRAAERARFLAAQIRLREGEARRAAETAAPLVEGEGDFLIPALLLRSRALLADGDVEGARRGFRALIERAPGSAEAVEARRSLRFAGESEAGGGGPGWFVQIASFADAVQADHYLEKRRAEGIGALSIRTAEVEGRTFHRVRIGPFDGKEEAEGARKRLGDQGIDGRVIREDGG